MARKKAAPKHDRTACGICPDVPGMGWKVPEVTHCRDCGFTWPLSRTRYQHCVRCHETFGGDEAATRHLNREGNCRPPAEVLHRDGWNILVLNEHGVWSRAFGDARAS